MPAPGQYLALLRHLGPAWLLHRVGYAARRKLGFLRRATPVVAWETLPAPPLNLQSRIVAGRQPVRWGAACADEAAGILGGKFRLFSHRWIEAGFPPDWHRNQMTGEPAPADRHWTELGDFAFGDIKGVWELSRFSWAFALARAFARTRDPRYAEAFWRLFADWCHRNPPNVGPNWMCGQEATFRLMAAAFGAEVMGVPPAERDGLARFVVATGRRIAANVGYALSQKNNHGVSECVGLITAALLVPSHAESAGWLARGLRNLEAQLNELVYPDGGFAQHSLIYHRVLLHDIGWCRSRMVSAGQATPAWLDAAGRRALDFLMTLVDPATGQAPLYGANDGSNVLPLAEADFLDLRPVVQATAAVFRGELPLPEGPWDEAAAWLVADWGTLPRVQRPSVPARWHARAAGCFQMTHGSDRLFLRCPEKFRHRPGQADMLHLDIRNAGRPVAQDGGSFSYNTRERFATLGAAAQHNVLTVDGREPLEKFSRFLYLPWPAGTAGDGVGGSFRASHEGYAKLGVRWTREVSPRAAGGFAVRDRIEGAAGHRLTWHWRLADASWQISDDGRRCETRENNWNYAVGWQGMAGCHSRLVRADDASAYGWWSPYYGEVEPACALLIEADAVGDVELVTEFGPFDSP